MRTRGKLKVGRAIFIVILVLFLALIFTLVLAGNNYLKQSLVIIAVICILLSIFMKYLEDSISRQADEEQRGLRQQLTQNVAHELKTPVSSILGYLDTILDNPDIDEKTKEQFLRRCQSQTRRLSSLVGDISTLNKMDNTKHANRDEIVDISELVAGIVQETQQQLEEKKMTFHNELPFGVRVHGDQSMIYSIFRNLTDNAIAYAGVGTRNHAYGYSGGRMHGVSPSQTTEWACRKSTSRTFSKGSTGWTKAAAARWVVRDLALRS